MRDTNLIFNTNQTITASSVSGILDISKWSDKGVWVQITHIGVAGGVAATITARVLYSDSATFAGNADGGQDIVTLQTGAGWRRAVLCQSRRRYARIAYTVSGTTPSFTGIYAHVVTGPDRDDAPGVNTV